MLGPIDAEFAAQGPPGPPSYATMTAGLSQPGVGQTVPFQAKSITWMFQGQSVQVPVGGVYTVAATPAPGDLSVQLTNSGSGNAPPGTAIAKGSIIVPTGLPGSPGGPGPSGPSGDVGFSRDSAGNATIASPGIIQSASSLARARDGVQAGWTALTTDAATTVYTLADPTYPTIAPNEVVDLTAVIRMRRDDGSDFGEFRRTISIANIGGTLQLRGGLPFSDTDATPGGWAPAGFAAAIVAVSGPTLAVQVTRPAGVASHAKVFASWERDLPPSATIVSSITPAAGPFSGGTPVAIVGQGFSGASAVVVGGASLAPGWAVMSDTLILGVTGAGAIGLGNVVVTVGGQPYTLAGAWTGLPTALATIASVTPNIGFLQGGTALQIVGTGFTAASAVLLDGVPAASYAVVGDTAINAVAAAGVSLGTGSVAITNAAGTFVGPNSGAKSWTYAPNPPVFGAVAPLFLTVSVAGGIAITGSGFLPATDAGVKIGATKYSMGGTMTVNGPGTQVSGTVDPTAVGKGAVYVTIGGIDYVGPTFWSVSGIAPSFTIAPTSGLDSGGTSVAITGSHLTGIDIPSVGGVTFSDGTHTIAAASVVYVDDGHATAVTAADGSNSGTGVCAVTAPAGAGTQPWTYVFPPPPTLTRIGPWTARPGDKVFLHGTGFSASAPTVSFGATNSPTVVVSSDTLATAIVPPGLTPSATAVSVTVITVNGTSAGKNWYCLPSALTFLWVADPDLETAGAGSNVAGIVDVSGTYNAVQATSASQPTDSTSALTGGLHSLHWAGGQQLEYAVASLPGLTVPYTLFALSNANPASQTSGYIMASVTGTQSFVRLQSALGLVISSGGSSTVSEAVTAGVHLLVGVVNNTGSVAVDNGTPTTGAIAGPTTFAGGISIGSAPNGTSPFVGDLGFWGVATGTLSSGDLAIVHGIAQFAGAP